jgi:hypothetical protein
VSSKLPRFLVTYFAELLIGALLLTFADLRWFLFFLLIELLLLSDHLRKMIRVFQSVNDVRFMAIIRKLKISDDDLSIVTDSMKMKVDEQNWNQLEKEMQDLL